MKFFLLLTLSGFLLSCSPLQTNSAYPVDYDLKNSVHSSSLSNNSSCLAKCTIPYEGQIVNTILLQYTGDNYDDSTVEQRSYEIAESTTKWVKKRADKNCLSANPDDCLVWCLQEIPALHYEYYTVIDTHANKQFIIGEVDKTDLIENGLTQLKYVVCEEDISSQLIYDIQNELSDRGYISDEQYVPNPEFDSNVKKALVQFQKDNSLPIGQLDLETLRTLGVDY